MQNPTVKVTFDPTVSPPKFTFVDDTVRMNAAGRIILIRDGASPSWRFRGATVKDDVKNQFHPELQGNGSLHIIDDFKDTVRTSYSYNVTVIDGTTTYTSPDPVIVNEPGMEAE